jgi:hypothetical protein
VCGEVDKDEEGDVGVVCGRCCGGEEEENEDREEDVRCGGVEEEDVGEVVTSK